MQLRLVAVTFFALFALILDSSTMAYAAEVPVKRSRQKLKTKAADPTAVEETAFSMSMSASRSQSLYDFQDGTRKESNSFEFLPTYQWRFGKTQLFVAYEQDLRRSENSDLADMALIHGFKGWSFETVKLIPGITMTIPQAKLSRERYNLDLGIASSWTVAVQEKLLVPGFYFRGGVSLGRNFHRYDQATNGEPLTRYSFRQFILTGYSIGRFSFDAEAHHVGRWDYKDSQRETFEHSEEATVAFADQYGFTLGHTNSGSIFKANGSDSNVSIVDENASLVYAKLSVNF